MRDRGVVYSVGLFILEYTLSIYYFRVVRVTKIVLHTVKRHVDNRSQNTIILSDTTLPCSQGSVASSVY
jgi:uncharacterized membrane protein YiaA